MTVNTKERVKKHRTKMRNSGLRPNQLWIPNTRNTHFLEEGKRQSHLVTTLENQDEDLMAIMDELWADLEGPST